MKYGLSFLVALLYMTTSYAQQVIQVKPGESVTITGVAGDVTPPPQPPQPPTPAQTISGFVVFEDSKKAGQFRSVLLTDPTVQQYIKENKLRWRIVDINDAYDATDVAKQFADVKGKVLPYRYMVDAMGDTVSSGPCPLTPPEFLAGFKLPKGNARHGLGNIVPTVPSTRVWPKVGQRVGDIVPIVDIPRSQWKEVDLTAFLSPIRNQGSVGKCNASATCNAFEIARNISGLPFYRLSDDYLYGNICMKDRWGRRIDSGSLLEDGLAWMTDHGTCTQAVVPDGVWNPQNGFPASASVDAKDFTTPEVYNCPTRDSVASAVQQGFPVIIGIMWYDNFFNPQADGWLPDVRGGSAGGHAICCVGLVRKGNTWGFLCVNSWGKEWGKNGLFIIPEKYLDNSIGGYWAIRGVKQSRFTRASDGGVAPQKLFDSVRWVRILAGVKTAFTMQDYSKILEYANEIAALVGPANVAQDVTAITKAVAAKDWLALIPPMIDLIQYGIKYFGIVAGPDETIEYLKSCQMPQTPAPTGYYWTKPGDINIPAPWKLERQAVPAPQAMQSYTRPGVLKRCVNGVCDYVNAP